MLKLLGLPIYSSTFNTFTADNTFRWYTITGASGKTISNIVWSHNNSWSRIAAIEVDGTILTDFQGTNSFYLPMDGNSPIGQDKSGNGNDWTPVNFGGSVELDKATGALPILNTTQGGTQAGVSVFGSKENKYYTVTTANGSVYQFDITSGDNPSLEFIRGATYKFDYSSHTGHPVLFSSTNPDSSTTAYTDGTSISSNVISFTVPHNAPDTLYYYCQNHATAMNGAISVTTDETKADPYAWKCILAVPGVGGDYTDKSAQINCTSTTKASSAGGDPSSDSSSNFYGSSIDLDGNDKLTYTRTNAGDFSAQNDFTIEAWFNTDTTGATDAALFSNWDSGNNRSILFGPNASGGGKFTFIFNTTGSGSWTTVANPTAYAGKWVHVAWVYDHSATRHYAYINGILEGSATGTAYNNSTANFLLGVNKGDASGYYNGKVQDLRYYHAVKYTASGTTAGEVVFTPASTNPDILPDTPSGVSGGSKLTKITDGAVSFDGPTDGAAVGTGYLSVPSSDSSDFNFGTGDFTWEAFVYGDDWTGGSSNQDQFVIHHEPTAGGDGSGLFVSGGQSYYYSNKASSRFIITGPVLRDKRWYHIAASRESGTLRLFVDGVSVGSASYTDTYADSVFVLGRNENNNKNQFRGFISNFRVIKGTALYTSNFTPPTEPLTNVTNTKLLCCQSNTSATEAAVTPGSITANGDTAATTFNPFNTDIHTVRGQETGYATLNPLDTNFGSNLKDGNLQAVGSSNWNAGHARGSIALTSGKWFWESTYSAGSSTLQFGFANTSASLTESYGSVPANSWTYYFPNSSILFPSGGVSSYFTSGASLGDTIGCALDMDNGTWQFFKNGVGGTVYTLTATDSGSTASITELYPWVGSYNGTQDINFGQKPFKFPPPEGFQPLNAANVRPTTVISRPDQYIGIVTFIGTGTTPQSIRGLNFNAKPDLVWIKDRDNNYSHRLADSVRGSTRVLFPDQSNNEQVNEYGTIDKFTLNGFDLRQGSNNNGDGSNTNNADLVAWCWRAGGSKNTFNVDDVGYASAAAAGLDGGTLTPSGSSIGTKQGFSIIQWEGTNNIKNISHGLSQTPEFIINKNIDTSSNWYVGSSHLGTGNWLSYLVLNGTPVGEANNSDVWQQGGVPNATTFGVGAVGNSTGTHIAYLWHDVPGLQKFGKYSGTGSSGNFIELGFRPALLMIKSTSAYGWAIVDTTRSDYNVKVASLYPNKSDAEYNGSGHEIDYLSNGFNLRNSNDRFNRGSTDYIYAAWAEAPAFNLYGGQSNAR